jgi:hypothetical protein
MNEKDYLKATNRAKVSMALSIIKDVCPGDGYGITPAQLSEVKIKLKDLEVQLFSSYDIKESS